MFDGLQEIGFAVGTIDVANIEDVEHVFGEGLVRPHGPVEQGDDAVDKDVLSGVVALLCVVPENP